ncbi:MAG: 5'-nucleotidase C-terminal domain-containing protein [Bacteroidales bacterium]|jgi:2',3'-cyclic-nucleotide 2'-phosphodiesterase (5'-nucleotidase family)|nr:5'-nucleotidase C-terminal domain-containing protein [Bacteroidales bacterium]
MKNYSLLLSFLLFIFVQNSNAQNNKNYSYEYTSVQLDSSFSKQANPELEKYLHKVDKKMSKQIDIVIGRTESVLASYRALSPLSNLLTDLLYQYGNHYLQSHFQDSADLALLNFGGIRQPLPKGDITIRDVYNTLSFDNTVVIMYLKGSDLKKIIGKMREKTVQPFSHLQIVFKQQAPATMLIDGKEIDSNRIYKLVTIDFIATGGDDIIEKNIVCDHSIKTNIQLRNAVIEEIKKETAQNRPLIPTMDDRIIIMPQY